MNDLTTIIEEKTNFRFTKFSERMRKEMQSIFFMNPLVHEKAREFVARKVSKQTGDVRVAFDIMKSGF